MHRETPTPGFALKGSLKIIPSSLKGFIVCFEEPLGKGQFACKSV